MFRWAQENGKGLTQSECTAITQTKDFQAALRAARNLFYKELATDPSRSKNVALGQAVFAIQKLLDNQQYDKAVASLMMLFKMEGWTQEGTAVNIFQQINAKDFESLRQKLKESQLLG